MNCPNCWNRLRRISTLKVIERSGDTYYLCQHPECDYFSTSAGISDAEIKKYYNRLAWKIAAVSMFLALVFAYWLITVVK